MTDTAISRRRKAPHSRPSTKKHSPVPEHDLDSVDTRQSKNRRPKTTLFTAGLSTLDTTLVWTPSFSDAIKAIAFVRMLAGIYSNIQDCDEVFNYWEPTHYLQYGTALQTWEYAPQYAIRSWAYITFHAIITISIEYALTTNKLQIFYLTRLVFALASAYTEAQLYETIRKHVHPRIARYTLVLLMASPGMFIASTAYLPSTFSMYTVTWAFALYLAPPSRKNTWILMALATTGAFWGWPFAGFMFIPFCLAMLFSKKRSTYLRWIAEGVLIAVSTVMAPLLVLDRFYYQKWVFASLNIVLYNVFGSSGRGPDIYGTEPWYFYFLNGLLNFNLAYVAALVCGPLLLFIILVAPALVNEGDKRILAVTSKGSFQLVFFYLWLAIFTIQSHKEERFMFVVFPIICFYAATTLYLYRGILEMLLMSLGIRISSPKAIAKMFTVFTLGVFVVLSALRIYAGYIHYHAPIDVYTILSSTAPPFGLNANYTGTLSPEAANRSGNLSIGLNSTASSDSPIITVAQALNRTVNVCVGKEWYRFPSHYFLQPGMRLRVLPSAFKGLLPKYFKSDMKSTQWLDRMLREGEWNSFKYGERRQKRYFAEFVDSMNDLNREEVDRYWSVDQCDYIIDTSPQQHDHEQHLVYDPNSVEPIYAMDTETWKRLYCTPFLDSQHSSLLVRVLGLPGHRVWLDYCLLVRRKLE
ncbi:mannosyltransferase [Batrachochytrium dendrobatidis]|nr:mannosyltransferase [Batrachochytrium dendrobatidis]